MICVAGHQPNHLPYGGFFAKLMAVDRFVIVDNTQYVKKQYHNRNRICLHNGRAHWLSVPVITAGRFTQKINEVEIDDRSNWRATHLKTIDINYRKCAHFATYFSSLRELYERPWTRLFDFNLALIHYFSEVMEIDTPMTIASDIGVEGKATELIYSICQQSGAAAYLHGRHGRDYVDFELLQSRGIENRIQSFEALPYPQTSAEFVPNLSVLDLLFNCGAQGAKERLTAGNTITVERS